MQRHSSIHVLAVPALESYPTRPTVLTGDAEKEASTSAQLRGMEVIICSSSVRGGRKQAAFLFILHCSHKVQHTIRVQQGVGNRLIQSSLHESRSNTKHAVAVSHPNVERMGLTLPPRGAHFPSLQHDALSSNGRSDNGSHTQALFPTNRL
ncbi:exo-alpha-sialidase [Trypanosoma cruzi]|nr:exo-alpha-sialidase [Trypanosoma cruzi]